MRDDAWAELMRPILAEVYQHAVCPLCAIDMLDDTPGQAGD